MSLFSFRCGVCRRLEEVKGSVGEKLEPRCTCGALMARYFGTTQSVLVNTGFVASRYGNETDLNIAKFQFENL